MMRMLNQLSVVGTVLVALAPAASAHMIMASPKPFGSPNSSPLEKSGADFPCKMVAGGSTDGPMNEFAVGSQQTLSFTGSAVHGGGSCQLSFTTDNPPTKDSKFKVIYSIEGGCPASAGGNLAIGVNDPTTFPFTVPPELPNGVGTMAWTWFNHIGNREAYMNCAHVTVSGGSDDKSKFESLPDMAVANVGSVSTCATTEGFDYTFDNPGKYTTRIGAGPFKALCGGAATPGDGAPAPGVSSVVTPPTGQMTSTAVSPPMITSTVSTLITVTAPSGPVSTGSAEAPVRPIPSSSQAPAPVPSQAPPATGGDGTCSPDGAVICNGESQFGLCDHGKVVFQPVAAGTKCQNGVIAKRDFTHRAQRTVI